MDQSPHPERRRPALSGYMGEEVFSYAVSSQVPRFSLALSQRTMPLPHLHMSPIKKRVASPLKLTKPKRPKTLPKPTVQHAAQVYDFVETGKKEAAQTLEVMEGLREYGVTIVKLKGEAGEVKLVCQWEEWKVGELVEVVGLRAIAPSLHICSSLSPVSRYPAKRLGEFETLEKLKESGGGE